MKRNPYAVRGPSLLSEVVVTSAPSLGRALRAFESGESDVGWLGGGLHQQRPGSKSFDVGVIGWVVARPGKHHPLGRTPGTVQHLIDGISPQRLAHLGLELGRFSPTSATWNGPSDRIVVPSGDAHLTAVAHTIARVWSRPNRELRVSQVPPDELDQVIERGRFSLCLRVVRRIGPTARDMHVALATADGRWEVPTAIMPHHGARQSGLWLHLGVIGAIRGVGSVIQSVGIGRSPEQFGWDWAETFRRV